MGMAWDTGAPLWPYQAPDTLLFALNLPAYLIVAPVTYWKIGVLGPIHYLPMLIALLLWWSLVGHLITTWRRNVIFPQRRLRSALSFLAAGLLSLGLLLMRWPLHWWLTYSRQILSSGDLIFLRLAAPSLWCFGLFITVLALLKSSRRLGAPTSMQQ